MKKKWRWNEGAVLVLLFVVAVAVKYYVQIGIILGVVLVGWWLFARRRKEKVLRYGIQVIDQMKRREFTAYLQTLFKAHGYSTKVTREHGLMLSQRGRKIVVHATGGTSAAVQQVLSAKLASGADEAWVVSNREYTPSTYRLASLNGVRLINRERLILLMIQANPAMQGRIPEQENFDLLSHK